MRARVLIGLVMPLLGCSSFLHFDGSSAADASDSLSEDAPLTDAPPDLDVVDAGQCPVGFADCNGLASDGCESSLSSPSSCASCGVTCGTTGTTAVACGDGGCELTCAWDHADCDGDPSNGCERMLDINHCGNCTTACLGGQICCYSVSRIVGDCRSALNCQ